MKPLLPLAALLLAGAGALWWWQGARQPADGGPAPAAVDAGGGAAVVGDDGGAVANTLAGRGEAAIDAAAQRAAQAAAGAEPVVQPGLAAAEGVLAHEVAHGGLDDDQYARYAALLARDPAFRQGLVTELQGESERQRARWLAWLLGESSDLAMNDVAAQMLAGGGTSAWAALELLSRRQQRDPQARALIEQVLDSGAGEQTVLAALHAVAKPTADPAARAALALRLGPLLDHPAAAVRAQAVALLYRNAPGDPRYRRALVAAMADPDRRVRRNAVNGFAAHPRQQPEAIAQLLAVLEQPGEKGSTRRAAARALEQLQLDPGQLDRLAAARQRLP